METATLFHYFGNENVFSSFVDHDKLDVSDIGGQPDTQAYAQQTRLWPQQVYYAWVMYGATSFSVALYYLQRFYFANWYSDTADYKSSKPNSNTVFGVGESFNRVAQILTWCLTTVAWMLTLLNWDGTQWFFTVWASLLHPI